MLILHNMRKCVLILLIAFSCAGLHSCAEGAAGVSQEAPELLKAVPSDALCVGLFGRLDHGMEQMIDSLSALRSLDFGKLSRSRAAIALCDIGSVCPLLIIEAGKAGADTLESVRSLLDMADTLKLGAALLELDTHDALLLSESSTVITIARRHVASESSILDAPDFPLVLDVLTGADAIVLRNRGANRLQRAGFGPLSPKTVAAFVRDAAEWTVLSGGRLWPVCPDSDRYFTNFIASVPEAPSKFAASFPEGAVAVVDLPLGELKEWRSAYEGWLDARIELESYQKRLDVLKKSAGKDPLNWEKELGVKEVSCVMMPEGTLNMVRTAKSVSSDGVQVNPYKGFVRALYGSLFNPADSCCVRSGVWLISGERALLDSLKLGGGRPSSWPAAAKVVAWSEDNQINWTKENIKIWNSNR